MRVRRDCDSDAVGFFGDGACYKTYRFEDVQYGDLVCPSVLIPGFLSCDILAGW